MSSIFGFGIGIVLVTSFVLSDERYAIPFSILWAAYMICTEKKKGE